MRAGERKRAFRRAIVWMGSRRDYCAVLRDINGLQGGKFRVAATPYIAVLRATYTCFFSIYGSAAGPATNLTPIFAEAEALAKQFGTSRSELYRRALSEYIARHAADPVTRGMDEAVGAVGAETDEFDAEAARRVLKHAEW